MRHTATKSDRIRQHLLRQITNGNYPRGSVLPPERELAEELQVSHMTLRKAIGELVNECYLTRVPRVGTFVANEISSQKVQQQVGVVIPAWSAPENYDFLSFFCEAAEEKNFLVKQIFARSWEDRAVLDAWNSCDALCCLEVLAYEEIPEELIRKFKSGAKPVVLIGGSPGQLGFDGVTGDLEFCGDMILGRLARAGHRRIAFIDQAFRTPENTLVPYSRCLYRQWREHIISTLGPEAVKELEILVDVPRFRSPLHPIHDRLLEFCNCRPLPFTAVIVNLSAALAVTSAFADLGIRIPEEVSIVASGERQDAVFYRPELSYRSVSLREHARKALELIQWRAEHPDEPPRQILVRSRFITGKTIFNRSGNQS